MDPKPGSTESMVLYCSKTPGSGGGTLGEVRRWLRGDGFGGGPRRLAGPLPIPWQGTVRDGELTAGSRGRLWKVKDWSWHDGEAVALAGDIRASWRGRARAGHVT